MGFKKLMIVFFLVLFTLAAVWAVNVVNKASENRSSDVTHTPRYTPREIETLLASEPDYIDNANKRFLIFKADSKIPVAEVEGLNDTEIVRQLMIRYLDHFRALPPEDSLYIKGYTIDAVYRPNLATEIISSVLDAIFPKTAKNREEIFRVYHDIVGAIPHTASHKEVFRVYYTVIPYKEFNTKITNPPYVERVPVTNSEFNTQWIIPSAMVSKDGTGLRKGFYLFLSKDSNFYAIDHVAIGL